MRPDRANNSIHIKGDVRGAVTAGTGNVVNVGVTGAAGTDPLDAALADLRRLIDEHAAELPQHRLAIRDVERLADEVDADEPDRAAVQDTLDRLTARVGLVGALADALVRLKDLITGLWPG